MFGVRGAQTLPLLLVYTLGVHPFSLMFQMWSPVVLLGNSAFPSATKQNLRERTRT